MLKSFFRSEPQRLKWALTLCAFLGYALIFLLFYKDASLAVRTSSVLPVIVAGWYFGLRGGMLSIVFDTLLSAFLLYVTEYSGGSILFFYEEAMLTIDIVSVLTLILIAIAIGWLSDRTRQQKAEIEEAKAEQRHLDELATLHAIAMAITTTTDEHHLIEKITQIIGENLYPSNFGVLMVDEEEGILRLHSTYHIIEDKAITDIPMGEGITGQVARSGQTLRVPDVSLNPHYIMAAPSTRSELCVPIKIGTRVVGVINAESSKLDAFSQADEDLLTTISGQLSTAIDRLRVATEQRQWAEQLERSNTLIRILAQVAARIETASGPDGVMHLMGDELKKLGLNALVALFIPGTQELLIRYTSIESQIIERFERLAGHTMDDFRIFVEKLPAYLNLSQHPHPVFLPAPLEAIAAIMEGFPEAAIERLLEPAGVGEKMLLGHFPLIVQEKVLGFMWLWGGDLRETDMPTMSIFANQVAVALENARLFAEVQRLAVTDELTGLHNRRHFFNLAFAEFYRARRYARALSVLMLDIDHFKRVNDKYGHAAGDIVLQSLGKLCTHLLRDLDIIGRYGGEEFVILLPETDLAAAKQVAQRIRSAISELSIPTTRGEIYVTASIGAAGDNVDELNLLELIEHADEAMYAAKRAGRNCVMVYEN
ncbi:MAG: diguanylate cyclase [Chloroflexi bacterium]|nr:diguanylate cyclase [Chloroflexota bacterium]